MFDSLRGGSLAFVATLSGVAMVSSFSKKKPDLTQKKVTSLFASVVRASAEIASFISSVSFFCAWAVTKFFYNLNPYFHLFFFIFSLGAGCVSSAVNVFQGLSRVSLVNELLNDSYFNLHASEDLKLKVLMNENSKIINLLSCFLNTIYLVVSSVSFIFSISLPLVSLNILSGCTFVALVLSLYLSHQSKEVNSLIEIYEERSKNLGF
jgi:hypothetical protein